MPGHDTRRRPKHLPRRAKEEKPTKLISTWFAKATTSRKFHATANAAHAEKA